MEMILTDVDRLELSYLDIASYIDIDVGNTNDFEISLSREDVRRYDVKRVVAYLPRVLSLVEL